MHISSFSRAADFARQVAARHLWQVWGRSFRMGETVMITFFYFQLIMVHADVSGTFSALKDFFLLGNGHLFQVENLLFFQSQMCSSYGTLILLIVPFVLFSPLWKPADQLLLSPSWAPQQRAT